MDPAIRHWVDLWDYLDGNFWSLLGWFKDELSADEIGWQPVPAVASIGWNLQHLGEMLDHYLANVFQVGSPVQQSPLTTMISGSKDDGRHRELNVIAAYHQKLRPAYRRFLSQLTLADLDRVIERHGRRSFTYAWLWGTSPSTKATTWGSARCCAA